MSSPCPVRTSRLHPVDTAIVIGKVSTYVVNDSMHENLMANLSVVEDGEEVIVK